jgi:chloramphenicol 3-O-phosphotransferase
MPIFSAEVPTIDMSDKMNMKRSSLTLGTHSGDEEVSSFKLSMLRDASEKIKRDLAGGELDNFYVIGDKALRNVTGTKLCGRDVEIEQTLLFLFGNDTFAASREHDDKLKPIFSVDNLAKYVILHGTQGMGKTAIANAISQHIYCIAKLFHAYNIQLFKSLVGVHVLNTPFSAWKSVLQEMVLRLYQGVKEVVDTKKRRRHSLAASMAAVNKELHMAIDHLFALLPDEWKDYRPLISRITNVEEDCSAMAALNLKETDMNDKLMELAVAIVQIYPKVTRRLAFVVM